MIDRFLKHDKKSNNDYVVCFQELNSPTYRFQMICQGIFQYYNMWITFFILGTDMVNIEPVLENMFLSLIIFGIEDIFFKATQERM